MVERAAGSRAKTFLISSLTLMVRSCSCLEELGREVPLAAVGEDCHDKLPLHLRACGNPESSGHRRPRGHPGKDALLLCEPSGGGDRIRVRDLEYLVEEIPPEDVRDEAGTDPLDLVGPGFSAREDRGFNGFHRDGEERGLPGLDDLRGPGDGATG